MQISSNLFIFFLAVSLLIYYLLPKKMQWLVLLAVSYVYYVIVSPPALFFLLFSTVVTYVCGVAIEKRKTASPDDPAAVSACRRIMLAGLLLDIGMLAFLKYTNFILGTVNGIAHTHIPMLKLLLPLGISYYTFSTVGYILDVYWGRIKAEHNFLHLALFVSFFPQLLQGPISRFGSLGHQLWEEHSFSLHILKEGMMRIVWGLFKKMVLADWAAVYVDAIFADMDTHSGLILIGMILYAIQLYCDFSGGIDVMIGVASLFGITLDENFRRPYFAVSLPDFWRRWHITLGTWMKDYVMYPLTLSKGMNRLGKNCKKVFGRKRGRLIPICISNIIVFVLVGIWHGAAWRFVLWGLYNGVIIALGSFFAKDLDNLKKKLHINDKAAWYHGFLMLRTFLLVIIGYLSDLVDGVSDLGKSLQFAFTRFSPGQILSISSGKLGTAYTPYALLTLVLGCLLLLVISILQERGIRIRSALGRAPLAVSFAACLVLLLSIPLFGPVAMARGFIYAQF